MHFFDCWKREDRYKNNMVCGALEKEGVWMLIK